jgi:hypothetical protein
MEEELTTIQKSDYTGFLKGLEFYHKYINQVDFATIQSIKESLIISSFDSQEVQTETSERENEIANPINLQLLSPNEYIDLVKDNNELKNLNEILEREVNLLKSLILINNLNLNSKDIFSKSNYFIDMCNEENVKEVIHDDKLFNKQKTLHTLIIKINVRDTG